MIRLGHVFRVAGSAFRDVHLDGTFIGIVILRRRHWLARLAEPPWIYPYVTDAGSRPVRWRTRAEAMRALLDAVEMRRAA